MAKHPRSYPPEFRHKIIELVRSGRSGNDVAHEFGISRQTLSNWLKQDDVDTGRRSDGLTSAENEEVTRLRKRVRQLEIEREILSKAAAWLARSREKQKWCPTCIRKEPSMLGDVALNARGKLGLERDKPVTGLHLRLMHTRIFWIVGTALNK